MWVLLSCVTYMFLQCYKIFLSEELFCQKSIKQTFEQFNNSSGSTISFGTFHLLRGSFCISLMSFFRPSTSCDVRWMLVLVSVFVRVSLWSCLASRSPQFLARDTETGFNRSMSLDMTLGLSSVVFASERLEMSLDLKS